MKELPLKQILLNSPKTDYNIYTYIHFYIFYRHFSTGKLGPTLKFLIVGLNRSLGCISHFFIFVFDLRRQVDSDVSHFSNLVLDHNGQLWGQANCDSIWQWTGLGERIQIPQSKGQGDRFVISIILASSGCTHHKS